MTRPNGSIHSGIRHGLLVSTETVARETPLWQAWIQEGSPMPSQTSQSD
jgi:hypothetical protein